MALDPTSSESNFIYSVRRYIMENLGAPGTIELTFLFDQGLTPPDGDSSEESSWVAVNYGVFDSVVPVHTRSVNLFACARKDMSNMEVASLTDNLVDIFTDGNNVDGEGRVPLYDASDVDSPVEIAVMKSNLALVSGHLEAEDGTRYQQLTVQFRWAARF